MKDVRHDGTRADGVVGPSVLLVWNGAVTRVRRIGLLRANERPASESILRAPEGLPARKRDPPIA